MLVEALEMGCGAVEAETRRVNDKPVVDGEREPSFLSKWARSSRAKRRRFRRCFTIAL